MSELMTVQIVDRLKDALSCNKKNLATLLNVTQQTLSNNIETPWSSIKDQKFGKNLLTLLFVVDSLSKDKTLDSKSIHKILYTARYPLEDGNIVDVVTGIRLGLSRELLVEIADKAVSHLRKSYDKRPGEESLYYIANN